MWLVASLECCYYVQHLMQKVLLCREKLRHGKTALISTLKLGNSFVYFFKCRLLCYSDESCRLIEPFSLKKAGKHRIKYVGTVDFDFSGPFIELSEISLCCTLHVIMAFDLVRALCTHVSMTATKAQSNRCHIL